MDALRGALAILLTLIGCVAVYVSGALLGWFIALLGILGIVLGIGVMLFYAVYEGLGIAWKNMTGKSKQK